MHATIKHYIKLTEFLANVLGPDYELTLYEVSESESSIVAIANGHISGRSIGAPLTKMISEAICNKDYLKSDSRINYGEIINENGVILRSSTFFITDGQNELIGVLGINFDDSRYHELSDRLLKLRHPDAFVETNFVYDKEKAPFDELPPGTKPGDMLLSADPQAIDKAVQAALTKFSAPSDRLTMEEKIRVISELEEKGIFMVKNGVKQVAKILDCSPASVYRYISKCKIDAV